MAAALATAPSGQCNVGTDVVVTGTGWSTNPVTITVENPELTLGVQVTVTPSSGAITTSGVVKLTPGVPGVFKFVATDGSSTVEADLEVFED